MIRHLEPGRVEGPIDGGSDLREERGRVRRREVGLQGRLPLPLLEEQNGVGVPTAYYTGDTFRPAVRRPLDDVLHIDRW